ncbi:MAG: alpha-galactosidase, partial [Thermoguttaceae bacterium]|nr:alpha-galactosidase [Thermoguttaceae bacterium]
RIDDYLPLESSLPPGAEKKIVADAGRPVTLFSPYFNIQAYDEGWIVVLGWPGTWFADFKRVDNLSLQVQGGQSRTHFKLLPGEEVRSPLVVVQAWKRDTWFDAQNVWRAWMIKHSIPRLPDGTFVDHHIAACSSHFFAEMTQANTESQITFIDRYLEENIPLDYWWMDAGWYPCDGQWPKTGTWEVDETRFPGGFRPISDHGHQKGVKTLVWFEPERVHSGTWLTENHPDWILGGADGGLLNYGNPEALDWTINHFDDLIKKNGIDLYRQDFNMEPGEYWRNGDTEDRQGITENHHVCGYLTYWDSLLKRNPGLRIDSCAGGGKRNELETMRRAVPLLRSDYILEAVGNQNQMLGISLWIPYHGTGIRALDDYGFRSIMSPYLNLAYDIREKESDYDNVRKNLNIWKTIFVPLYGKDYYPLSGLSDRDDATVSAFDINSIWAGWQFNDPENGNGAIQMFRRIKSQYSEGTFKLYGLDAGARYEFTDVDTGATQIVSGQELLETGLKIRIDKPETAIILSYRKL